MNMYAPTSYVLEMKALVDVIEINDRKYPMNPVSTNQTCPLAGRSHARLLVLPFVLVEYTAVSCKCYCHLASL